MKYLVAFRYFDDVQTNVIDMSDSYDMRNDKCLLDIKKKLTTNDDLHSPLYTSDGVLRPEFQNSYHGIVAISKLY